MCGFTVYVSSYLSTGKKVERIPKVDAIKHRGPDETMETNTKVYVRNIVHDIRFCFNRLSIVNIEHGSQPIVYFHNKKIKATVVCNGEIYNYKDIKKYLQNKVDDLLKYDNGGKLIQGAAALEGSDCDIIYPLFADIAHKCRDDVQRIACLTADHLDGDFAFVIQIGSKIIMARDPFGVRPLFYSFKPNFQISSEEMGLIDGGVPFPPGHIGIYDIQSAKLSVARYCISLNTIIPHNDNQIKKLLTHAVQKRLMSDRPVAYFLSGGLDSTLVAYIGSTLTSGKIKTFSIGMQDSSDLKAARKVANILGTDHTEVNFTPDEAILHLYDLIKHLASYDCTTVRASLPMYLLSKYISEKTPYRVVLSGEGSDELLGGYLYFHSAPSLDAFQNETIRRLDNLYMFDVLRSDRSTAAHGLEIRVPFLDKAFIRHVVGMLPQIKSPSGWLHNGKHIEKGVLREAFNNDVPTDLREIIWRQKEAFSDGVGYNWVRSLKEYAEKQISDEEFSQRFELYLHNVPTTKEEFLYRKIFQKMYPNSEYNISEIWRPMWTSVTDPSATQLAHHESQKSN
jgi:asparagine synthase (glutamine-hydrolysing)